MQSQTQNGTAVQRAVSVCARAASSLTGPTGPLRYREGVSSGLNPETNLNLLTTAQREQLLANGRSQRRAIDAGDLPLDFEPVVKLFTSNASATWLLTELTPENTSLAFALCDLGVGEPELGYVHLAELTSLHDTLGLRVERDLSFVASKPISAYAELARNHRRIVT